MKPPVSVGVTRWKPLHFAEIAGSAEILFKKKSPIMTGTWARFRHLSKQRGISVAWGFLYPEPNSYEETHYNDHGSRSFWDARADRLGFRNLAGS